MSGDTFDLKNIRHVAKKVLQRQIFRKISEIEDEIEQRTLFEYSIKSAFNLELSYIHEQIEKLKKDGRDVFSLTTKVHLLKSKIHLLHIDFDKKEFKKVHRILSDIKRELRNV